MSKKESYLKIINHYENCYQQYGDTSKGMDWPNLEDAILRYKIMLEVIRDKNAQNTLLDFGCGTGHLYQYILDNDMKNIVYSGLDISSKFVEVASEKYPQNLFYNSDILKEGEKIPNFDYIVCNGVFTEKRELSFEDMWEYCQNMLIALFEKVEKGIAFNVMSKAVDWERWDLFHLPIDLLVDFMTKKLSRNFIIRNDYGLYEYTVYLYK
ncbi:class I SAM-dependent methyltransferase (plasmid) [Bernardetia sp. Wsw4-3y2]|uniref:class I SAM-dependent methyltransferase n=1 Tax=Bernardetia sp. Wsw4-3y2 TaxID=3127471 RepID=UPI0030D57C3E